MRLVDADKLTLMDVHLIDGVFVCDAPKVDAVPLSVIDEIRAEIIEYAIPDFEYHGCGGSQKIVELEDVLQIIDKYRGEADCRECKAEYECYYCKKYEESEEKNADSD